MALGRFLCGLALAPVLTIATAAGGALAAQPEGAGEDAETREALQAWAAADPANARALYDLTRAHAGLAVRIERLVRIGVLCRRLSDEDAALIVANAGQEADSYRALLTAAQREQFALYNEGLRQGALVAADPGIPDAAACEAFAAPGGTLVKLLTWTGRPQFISPGVLASPRTLP
ncbi:hypothetical protein [Brevundimonas diminuta]|uniref:hypothetical protein n=1 Tax=Brevundimonas diminuta TaxID=293 RepID=UPI003D0649A7